MSQEVKISSIITQAVSSFAVYGTLTTDKDHIVLQQASHIWRGTHDHFGTKVLLHNLKEYVFWSRKMVDDILGNLYKKFYRHLKLDISSV